MERSLWLTGWYTLEVFPENRTGTVAFKWSCWKEMVLRWTRVCIYYYHYYISRKWTQAACEEIRGQWLVRDDPSLLLCGFQGRLDLVSSIHNHWTILLAHLLSFFGDRISLNLVFSILATLAGWSSKTCLSLSPSAEILGTHLWPWLGVGRAHMCAPWSQIQIYWATSPDSCLSACMYVLCRWP